MTIQTGMLTHRKSFMLSEKMYLQLRERAGQEARSDSDIVRLALEDYLNRQVLYPAQ